MVLNWFRTGTLAVLACTLLAACSNIPKDGPTASEVRDNAEVTLDPTVPEVGYAVVHLSPLVLAAANASAPRLPAFTALASRRAPGDIRIGAGDFIGLTIFEAQAGGLFIPREAGSRAGNFVTVPSQQVDASGSISVPYAGTVHVLGRTAQQATREITQHLSNRAIEPQVVLSILERRGNDVSVLGDVTTATRFPLDPGGIRVLGAIARAGGSKFPTFETAVTIQRGTRIQQAALTAIVKDPAQNVELAPGDVVYVSHEQKVFLVFGATPSPGSVGGINNRRFTFDNDNMTLTEAVGKAGGLLSDRANPEAIFVFRMEPRAALAGMGVDVSKSTGPLVPTIYNVDWSRSDGFFLANEFYIRNKDVIFVSEHPTADLLKFLAILRGFTGPAADIGEAGQIGR